MLHFFDVLYYIKKKFAGVDDVENINQKALAVEKSTDYDEQNKLIRDLVMEVAGGPDVRALRDMTVYIHPGRGNSAYKVVDIAVKGAYRTINDFTIDEKKLEQYRLFLSFLKSTDGASMNSKDKSPSDLNKESIIDDEALQRFVRTFNALKENNAGDLYSIVHFIYENGLQNVMFRRMNRDLSQLNISYGDTPIKDLDSRLADGKKFVDVVPNECLIIVPILEEMKDLKALNNKLREDFYRVFLSVDDYNDDKKFLDDVKKFNKNFIDLNFDKINEIIKNTGQPDILKRIVSKRIEDVRAVKQDKEPDITSKFKTADVKLTVENLIYDYLAEENKIADDVDIEKVEALIDDSIISVMNYAVRKLSDIERNVYDYNALLRERIRIDSGNGSAVMLPLKEVIERWQAFIKTPLFGQEIMDGLLKQIKENEGGRFDKLYSGFTKADDNATESSTEGTEPEAEQQNENTEQQFEFKILKENVCDNIIRVIENFKITNVNDKEASDGLREITGEKKMSADRELACKVEILRLLINFFGIPFDIKKTLQMTKAVAGNTYYDAACVLVYIKDNKIKESYTVGDVMLFEGNVLFEEHNWMNYFKELSRMVMDFIAKRREVDKKADVFSYLRSQENKFETSREDENKIADEVVKSMDQLAKTSGTDTELDQMEKTVDTTVKKSGQTIKFKPEDAEGEQKPAEKNTNNNTQPDEDDVNNGETLNTITVGKPGAQ